MLHLVLALHDAIPTRQLSDWLQHYQLMLMAASLLIPRCGTCDVSLTVCTSYCFLCLHSSQVKGPFLSFMAFVSKSTNVYDNNAIYVKVPYGSQGHHKTFKNDKSH